MWIYDSKRGMLLCLNTGDKIQAGFNCLNVSLVSQGIREVIPAASEEQVLEVINKIAVEKNAIMMG